MARRAERPSVFQDLGSLADLYLTVFGLMRRRVARGRDWQEALAGYDPALTLPREEPRETVAPSSRQN